jgi:hypothetical protein
MFEEDEEIFKEMVKSKMIRDTGAGYEAIVGFPKLLIHINDKQLYSLSEKYNPDHYKYMRANNILTHKLKDYMHTINDIKVSDIKDVQPEKIGFMKVLGTKIKDETNDVMMYGKNKQTLFAAAKRQMKTAPNPKSKIAKSFIEYATHRIEEEIGTYLDNFSYDVTQWYNHLSGNKQRAIDPIMMYYTHPDIFDLTYTKEEAEHILTTHYEAIVKAELQPADGKPRMVCSIPQRIKYTMGPICWQLEEICAKHLNGYCGGMNLTEMADKINNYAAQGFTKVVEGDGSAFDNSQDISLKALDRYIYNRIKDKVYHVPKSEFQTISNLHYKTMDVKYHQDGKPKTYLSYKVLGTVFSGDSDTTLANTIRMAMYNIYVNEMEGLKYGDDFIVFSKGDDFSVFYKQRIPDQLIQAIYDKYFLKKPEGKFKIYDNRQYGIGQICKFLDIGDLSSFKFCSLRSWYLDDTYERITLTRDPKKLFTISQYSIKPKTYSKYKLINYHIQQSVAYKSSYQNIEIFDIMARAHILEAQHLYNLYHDDPGFRKRADKEFQRLQKSKKKMNTYDFGFDEYYNLRMRDLMEIKGRDNYEDLIYTQYWDNMQAKYNVRTEINTKKEYEFINQQINNEFDTEELKSLVGVTNF